MFFRDLLTSLTTCPASKRTNIPQPNIYKISTQPLKLILNWSLYLSSYSSLTSYHIHLTKVTNVLLDVMFGLGWSLKGQPHQ